MVSTETVCELPAMKMEIIGTAQNMSPQLAAAAASMRIGVLPVPIDTTLNFLAW